VEWDKEGNSKVDYIGTQKKWAKKFKILEKELFEKFNGNVS